MLGVRLYEPASHQGWGCDWILSRLFLIELMIVVAIVAITRHHRLPSYPANMLLREITVSKPGGHVGRPCGPIGKETYFMDFKSVRYLLLRHLVLVVRLRGPVLYPVVHLPYRANTYTAVWLSASVRRRPSAKEIPIARFSINQMGIKVPRSGTA